MFGQTIGVLGAGQLGRMLALAGYPLGLKFKFYDPDPAAPSGHLAECTVGRFGDEEGLKLFADSVDLITYEFENVPVTAAQMLAEIKPVYPPPAALEISQDRLTEKQFLQNVAIPVAPFAAIEMPEDIDAADEATGLPAVLKTRRMGYDGKGQCVVANRDELLQACHRVGGSMILEGFVPFVAECSLLAVRSVKGETKFYPLAENVHKDGILRQSRTPSANITPGMQDDAEKYATSILSALNYVGVLAIEFFCVDGRLVANEIAPRVHNSGHWSIEGAETSQFENHLRAILDLPLGSTNLRGHAGMLNIIGDMPDIPRVLAIPGAHLHLYGKSPRPNRKIGHVTVVSQTDAGLTKTLEELAFIR